MKNPKPSGRFTIKPASLSSHGFAYETFLLSGWLNGRRIRRQFKSREEALGEQNALQVEAANAGGEIRARNTRLNTGQIAEAEAAFARLGPKSLALAVEWFLASYKPPVTAMSLDNAVVTFLAEKAAHVREHSLRDYRNHLETLKAAFPGRLVHAINTADLQGFLARGNVTKKTFNNRRILLHAFFAYARKAPREWIGQNPVLPIPPFKLARGMPEIITAQTAADLMAYVETYAGEKKGRQESGYLAGYFALALFAGLRPSMPGGEIWKLGQESDPSKFVDLPLGVIRITPDIAKTNSVRQVSIQPNLMSWLIRFPLKKFPIIPRNARSGIEHVRKKFALGPDVLRHSFVSFHVARFKSVGSTALEAGNSESMVKKFYLNLVSEGDAGKFWSIAPGAAAAGEVIEMSATG